MANYNKVILTGNLTRDPELKYTNGGKAICKLGLAINREWKSESGEKKTETTFVDVDAFGKTAEVIAQYLKKGRPILVEGRLKLDQWDDKQSGQKRSKLGVVLESFQFIMDSGRGEAGSAPAGNRQSAASQATEPAAPDDSKGPVPEEDDVPF